MQKIEGWYGSDNRMVNVTEIILTTLVKDNRVIIPQKCDFNNYFGDHCIGTVKYLILTINDYKFVLKEGTIESQIIFDLTNNFFNKDKKITIVNCATGRLKLQDN